MSYNHNHLIHDSTLFIFNLKCTKKAITSGIKKKNINRKLIDKRMPNEMQLIFRLPFSNVKKKSQQRTNGIKK